MVYNGSGLGPDPPLFHIKYPIRITICGLTYETSGMGRAYWPAECLLSYYMEGRSRGRTRELPKLLYIPQLISQQYRDTWHEMIGPRVQISFVSNDTCPHGIHPEPSNQQLPRHPSAKSAKVRPSTWPYGLYGQVQSAPNFDHFDSVIKSRYLLHTDSIHENKYTAGIRKTRRTQWHWFRLNPSTLKIEQILIP